MDRVCAGRLLDGLDDLLARPGRQRAGSGVSGATVRLSVQGVAVGESAPLAVTLRDARNRIVGRGTGRMHRDRAVVTVEIDRQ